MDTESTSRLQRAPGAPLPSHEDIEDREGGAVHPKSTGRVNRWVMILIGVAVLGGGALFVRQRQATSAAAATAASSAAKERTVPMTVATVVKKDVPIWLEGLGNATPLATVNVKALVGGPIVSINFKEGQVVHKGDLLAQVDPRPYEIALHNAEAALARDTAQLRDARMNLDRYRTLRAGNLIAQQQVDDQQALADQYEGTTKADQAAIESAKLNLDYSHIVSPIEGVTGVRLIDLGNIVNPTDQTYIVILTQLDPMSVLFTLPEDDLPRVQQELAKGTIACEAYSRDGLIKLATGTLGLIDNEVNQTTATIRLKAFFPNKDRSLWPNEFVKTRLLLSTKLGALVVPGTVVQRGPKGTFAYVVNEDNTVAMRPIELVSTQGDEAIIGSGLQPGERVVTDGQNQLKPGSKITPRTSDAKPAGSSSASPASSGSGAPPASASASKPAQGTTP
jgi:multidrug efflux system membrane fusion protein